MKRTPLKRGNKPLKRSPFKRDRVSTKNALKVAKRPKSTSKKSMAWYKKELDRVFSLYIRKIHPARCYTCGKSKHRKKLQCGHFVSRQYLATRWSEYNCRPQCVGCNMFGNGKPLDFEENLKMEYGNDFVEEMKRSRHTIIKLDIPWYIEQIEKYKNLL